MTKDEVFMAMALLLGTLGTCPRKAVGAIIVKQGRCISWGYNGSPPGLPHCEANNHGWGWVDESAGVGLDSLGCKNTTHAEANSIAFAARQGISTDGGTLFVGVAPCLTCSHLIIAAGISTVYYAEEYRVRDGILLLKKANIFVNQLS